jgi:hypothetical protein
VGGRACGLGSRGSLNISQIIIRLRALASSPPVLVPRFILPFLFSLVGLALSPEALSRLAFDGFHILYQDLLWFVLGVRFTA